MLTSAELERRTGPILSDGTALRDLVDLERREVSLRVLNDPEIHELELKRIWAREWVAVGHVAEIPKAGDYVRRYIGEDQVLVVRDTDHDVRILLNVCAHRGMELCRVDSGHANHFACPYHGWVYNTKGKLVGAPHSALIYRDWDPSDPGYSLVAARVAVQSGIIFGSLRPNGPSLDEYLGGFKYYLDFTMGCDEATDLG